MSDNPELQLTVRESVDEVFGLLTGLDLSYDPWQDRFKSVIRQLNRALRLNALEKEWSWYTSTEIIANVSEGEREFYLSPTVRPRIINDDAVRLVDPETGRPVRWGYFLPRDALHKYEYRSGLWASVTRSTLMLSREIWTQEDGYELHVPVQREPRRILLPSDASMEADPENIPELEDFLDFQYPDVIVLRAAFLYAQTDPVMQPRVQTLEAQYKDLMYQIIERDDRATDSPYSNDFFVPIESGLHTGIRAHGHPHSDERR